jgi:hypothetical protein
MATPRTENSSKRAAKPRAAKPRAATASAPRRARGAADIGISAEERQRMIREAAYYRAERRGFGPGDAMADWLAAEAEVNALLEK